MLIKSQNTILLCQDQIALIGPGDLNIVYKEASGFRRECANKTICEEGPAMSST
jgi:hypothetical protein